MLDPASGSFSISLAGCIYVPAGLHKGEEINYKKIDGRRHGGSSQKFVVLCCWATRVFFPHVQPHKTVLSDPEAVGTFHPLSPWLDPIFQRGEECRRVELTSVVCQFPAIQRHQVSPPCALEAGPGTHDVMRPGASLQSHNPLPDYLPAGSRSPEEIQRLNC